MEKFEFLLNDIEENFPDPFVYFLTQKKIGKNNIQHVYTNYFTHVAGPLEKVNIENIRIFLLETGYYFRGLIYVTQGTYNSYIEKNVPFFVFNEKLNDFISRKDLFTDEEIKKIKQLKDELCKEKAQEILKNYFKITGYINGIRDHCWGNDDISIEMREFDLYLLMYIARFPDEAFNNGRERINSSFGLPLQNICIEKERQKIMCFFRDFWLEYDKNCEEKSFATAKIINKSNTINPLLILSKLQRYQKNDNTYRIYDLEFNSRVRVPLNIISLDFFKYIYIYEEESKFLIIKKWSIQDDKIIEFKIRLAD